jgi:hypothetical protein
MKQLVRNVKISGTGSYVPETIYTNEYLETIIPTNAQWIYENVGIKERHIAAPDQATSDLSTIAEQYHPSLTSPTYSLHQGELELYLPKYLHIYPYSSLLFQMANR